VAIVIAPIDPFIAASLSRAPFDLYALTGSPDRASASRSR
jgi:hypothetical protein